MRSCSGSIGPCHGLNLEVVLNKPTVSNRPQPPTICLIEEMEGNGLLVNGPVEVSGHASVGFQDAISGEVSGLANYRAVEAEGIIASQENVLSSSSSLGAKSPELQNRLDLGLGKGGSKAPSTSEKGKSSGMANCRAVAAEAQSPSQDDDISSSSRLCAKSPEVPKVACVAGPSMDGSEQTSNSNGYDFNNGFSPDFNLAENLNIESADNLGPSIGPGINLEVFLVHSPNVPEPPPKPIESYNLNPISSGLLALGQSVSPTPKSGPIGKIPMNLTHSAQSKLPILTKKSLHPEKKKGKKKINLEGFNSFARFHGYRTAAAQKPTSKSVIFRPAASVFAQSELSEGSSSSNKHLLEEAKATIQLGKSLGINYNGKEDIVLSKIIDLEIKDKDRISNEGKAQK